MRKSAIITAPRAHSQLETQRFRINPEGTHDSPVKAPFNQPHFNHFNTLAVKDVAGIKDKPAFGFDPYEMPKIGFENRVSGFSPSKGKFVGCYTVEQRVQGWIPTPGAIYVPPTDWKENFARRGKFGKYKRQTFTDEIFKYEAPKPSPQKYETKNWKVNRSPGNFKLTELKDSTYTQEAKWHSS